MKAYKPDQGRLARMFAFWSLAFMVMFGCYTLHAALSGRFVSMDKPLSPGLVIPIVSIRVNGAFLITGTLCLAGWIGLYIWLQREKVADLLIETEGELRKVTWPKLDDVTNSSLVVVFCVLFLMAFLAGADFLLGNLMQRILLGN